MKYLENSIQKNWAVILTAAVCVLTILGTLGFASPKEQVARLDLAILGVRAENAVTSGRVSRHDVQFAEIKADIDYIKDGIDDLRGLSDAERREKRRLRRLAR